MGSKSDTERAFADLGHALDALGDGVGQQVWGPGPVITRMMLAHKHVLAVSAMNMAASASCNMLLTRSPPRMIREMRTLAPVLLGLLLSSEEEDTEELATLFQSVTVAHQY